MYLCLQHILSLSIVDNAKVTTLGQRRVCFARRCCSYVTSDQWTGKFPSIEVRVVGRRTLFFSFFPHKDLAADSSVKLIQGAAQALEDSVTFSLLLTHYLSKSVQEEETSLDDFDDDDDQKPASTHALAQSIDSATKALYSLRHERVANIKTQTRNLYFGRRKITSLWWEYTYYCFLFLVTNFPRIGK